MDVLRGWCRDCTELRNVDAVAEAVDADVRTVTVTFGCGHVREQSQPLRMRRQMWADVLLIHPAPQSPSEARSAAQSSE